MNKSLLGLALGVAGAAQAQLFHLGVDLTDPANVVFTATSLPPPQTAQGQSLFDGITLSVFFAPPLASQAGGFATGSLRPWLSPLTYNTWASDDITPGLVTDLNIYRTGPGNDVTQTFNTFFQALAGSASIDLSAQAAHFKGLGTSGPIFSGWSGDIGPQIGVWQITAVPELPVAAHLAIYGAGFAGLAIYRRSRKA